jgi:preprotein translocase subunit SecB
MTIGAGPESGFLLERVVFPLQLCQAGVPVEQVDPSPFAWGWDWRWISADRFEVAIAVRIPPSSARPENVSVAVSGEFRIAGSPQTVALEQFVHGHAPAILFPYARQAIDDLTSRGQFGRFLLPPVNVTHLMTSIPAAQAGGARQIRPAV